jgi:hypothetical protein
MALSNTVTEMKMQGLNDSEIISKLKEQGINPFEINQALEQSQIKAAVSSPEPNLPRGNSEQNEQAQREAEFPLPTGMQPSVIETEPSPQEYAQQEAGQQQMQPQEYYPQQMEQQEYTPQQQMEQQDYYPEQGYEAMPQYQTSSSETMSEIAEYIFEERMSKIRKKLSEFENFKISSEKNIEIIDSKLKKIEKFLEEIQLKILGKIGDYGDNLENIKKEMEMMQDSFSKVLTPITEGLKKIEKKQKPRKSKK